MADDQDQFFSECEFIKDRLYFVTLNNDEKPKSKPGVHFFSIDKELQYEKFYADFGPLNISMLYHYCMKLNKKLQTISTHKKIIHYTTSNEYKRVNAVYLIGSYAIIYLKFTPEQAMDTLDQQNPKIFIKFRDASIGATAYHISLMDCLKAVSKALEKGFFNFDTFDFLEYEHYERVEHGDLNWIIPNKFIAFCGPHNHSRLDNGYPLHSPETYFSYFRKHHVSTIIRLNKKIYDANKFINAGFNHKDLYFIDGTTPCDAILEQFINICEQTKGVVAVHCKAGLGRTGSLIGCFLMKHYKFTAHEAIAWIRICRPGSIIGHQQSWLESKQQQMWRDGEIYRRKKNLQGPVVHVRGIYSYENYTNDNENSSLTAAKVTKQNDNVSRILKKVDTMKLNDNLDNDDDDDEDESGEISNETAVIEDSNICNDIDNNGEDDGENDEDDNQKESITQGDKLNHIKIRRQTRVMGLSGNKAPARGRSTRAINSSNSTTETPVLRSTKLVSINNKASSTPSSRVLTRNKLNEMQPLSPRRTRSTMPTIKTSPPSVSTKTSSENNENGFAGVVNGLDQSRKCALKAVKRSKRTLTVDKEKNSTRGVKMLRRSDPTANKQPSNSSSTSTSSQIHLPLVRVIKSKTP